MRQTRNLLGVELLLVGSNPTLSVADRQLKLIDLKQELICLFRISGCVILILIGKNL
ncbi:hypothetical protein L8106_05890 [Lyngbya sp. PCC 8106]|nr:hypothetical protein L8106_05890 [Lyngbya sp. PCC 8106]